MNQHNKKILIVEDNKDFLWILRQGFNGQPFAILYATTAEDGLQIALKEHPDLAIVDIMLPKMDGISMVKKMREEGLSSKIIFLTNLSDSIHVSNALEAAGQPDYIVKSDVHIDAIVARVREKLGITK